MAFGKLAVQSRVVMLLRCQHDQGWPIYAGVEIALYQMLGQTFCKWW